MSDTSNAIVIDLNSSNHSQPVAEGSQLIQRVAYENLLSKLSEDIKQAQDFAKAPPKHRNVDDDGYPLGSGLTYFIDGTRGAGKSTFLRYAYQHLGHQGKGERQDLYNDPKINRSVNVLPLMYLDPSRIESSEHVLLHILKRLKHLEKCCPDRSAAGEREQEVFRKSFKDLAGGLHVLSGSKSGLDDLDAELFLDHGLERAADSQRLRSKLHTVISSVCTMYGADALVLAIDDADTKAELAMEVLECLRKYLDSPQVVALVTGDLEMYSLLVQNHFQKDFASEDRGLNADRRKQQDRMVEHLEDQYLLKLFPIQRRVQLKTLHTLSERQTYSVITPGGASNPTLHSAVDQISTQGLRLRSKADKTLFREHVLKLPVRSVLQLLSSYFKLSESESAKTTDAASEALRATALSSLYRHDVDVESIAEGDLHATIEAAFNLSVRDGEPDTAVYLRPQSRDASLRSAYVSLAADVARLCENDPARAIIYMLVTAGSSNIFHLVAKKNGTASVGAENASELQKKIKQYLSVGRTDNALNWSWHATAALIGATKSKDLELRQGIVGVRTGKRGDARAFDDQLKEALNGKDSRAFPAIAFSQSGVKRSNNTQRYLSIFNTLGLIANLLELDVSSTPDLKKSISDQLNKVRNTPTVSLPNWSDLISSEGEDESESESERGGAPGDVEKAELSKESAERTALESLVSRVEQWLKLCEPLKKYFHPSAVLLGKIWNRLYFSLDNISSNMRATNETLESERCVKAMELFSWALINACLVEEVDYHHRDVGSAEGTINRSNPRSSGELVIRKFIRAADSKDIDVTPTIAPLTFMIASCPLLLGLIKDGQKGLAKDLTMQRFVQALGEKLNIETSAALNQDVMCDQQTWSIIGETTVTRSGGSPADTKAEAKPRTRPASKKAEQAKEN
ncbi:hypothetical protein [Ideonella sp.]|jgi:hypothetical protein|uniref:hypothetical protein n=1 Tax=Ideonella sp. TaxID=1929293 RepID=UPI0037C032A6